MKSNFVWGWGTDHQRDGRDPTSERCRKYCTKSALNGEAFKLQLRHYMARRKIEGKLSEVHFQEIHFGRNNMQYVRATFRNHFPPLQTNETWYSYFRGNVFDPFSSWQRMEDMLGQCMELE